MKSYIPDEIVDDIIHRLPRISLNRFKSVCKRWHSLISNPNFHPKIKQQECIFVAQQLQSLKVSLYSILDRKAVRESKPSVIFRKHKKPGSETLVSNSCNGTVIIRFSNYFFNYNPSVGCFSKIRSWVGECVCIGLCFDDLIQDFKFVVWYSEGSSSYTSDVSLKVRVGTVKSRRLNKIQLPTEIVLVKSGCLMNGMIHWIVEEKMPYSVSALSTGRKSMIARSKMILRFNSNENSFENFPSLNESAILCLGVLGESLCMARWIDEKIEVLVMKEYGVSESWTSLFFLSPDFRPFLFMTNGDVLMKKKDSSRSALFVSKEGNSKRKRNYKKRKISKEEKLPKLLSYNVNTKKIANLRILGKTNWWDAVTLVYNYDHA